MPLAPANRIAVADPFVPLPGLGGADSARWVEACCRAAASFAARLLFSVWTSRRFVERRLFSASAFVLSLVVDVKRVRRVLVSAASDFWVESSCRRDSISASCAIILKVN